MTNLDCWKSDFTLISDLQLIDIPLLAVHQGGARLVCSESVSRVHPGCIQLHLGESVGETEKIKVLKVLIGELRVYI